MLVEYQTVSRKPMSSHSDYKYNDVCFWATLGSLLLHRLWLPMLIGRVGVRSLARNSKHKIGKQPICNIVGGSGQMGATERGTGAYQARVRLVYDSLLGRLRYEAGSLESLCCTAIPF